MPSAAAGWRLLAQLPNRLRVEAELPERAWLEADGARDTIEQRWAEAEGRIEGTRASILLDDPEWEDPGPLPFQRRVYSLGELEQVLDRAGLTLTGVYDEQGAERPPDRRAARDLRRRAALRGSRSRANLRSPRSCH